MIHALKTYLYGTRFWHSVFKKRNELRHWRDRRDSVVKWFRAEQPYFFPYPDDDIKVKVENQHASYLKDLQLRADSFRGLRVADIGSGPFPTLLVFQDCDRYCIDHLIGDYQRLGFPLSAFKSDVHFIHAKTEKIPVPDMFFDAVVSRNALDHVDDFEATAAEIRRILKPDGILHILVNYHLPTGTEPHVLNDSAILRNFGNLKLRKLCEAQDAWGFTGGKTVLWSNAPESHLSASRLTL